MKIKKYIKNKPLFYFVPIFVVGILIGYLVNQQGKNQEMQVDIQINKENCLADDCLLVENVEYPVGQLPDKVLLALNEAINDEYKALAVYETVIAKFGLVRPFSMIKGAEEQHIASLKVIYDKYGVEVPENDWLNKVSSPATIEAACQIGVEAEIANAALYRENLIPAVKGYEDITLVFTNLMDASEQKHLPAFEKCN